MKNFSTNCRIGLLILFSFLISNEIYSQYYDLISTSAPTFVTDLESRIRSPYTRISYDNFDETNIANFASINNGNGTRSVFCVYSGYEYIYTGTFTWGTMSREHTWAHSWAPTYPSTSTDQYSDQYHLFPTNQDNANVRRSNHPLGIVTNVTFQFLEGKVGTNANGDIVYEPRDRHKGDAARALLYMSVRYDGIGGNSWTFDWLNNTRLPSLSEGPQDINILISWHNQDPPDKWEVDRNNYIQSIQQNRNPFVDHPEYVNYINFNNLTKLNPSYSVEPTNYVTAFSSSAVSSSIQVNWNDAVGAQLPSGYLLIAYNRNSYYLPIDGAVYANDTVLSDGFAVVNIPYANANTYTFSNLVSNTSYYFTIFSYNGTGSLTNYKIDGALPQSNSTISGSLAAEPSNYITNLATSNITSSSIRLNWTDAVPGVQAPSGYLVSANNTGSFITPSDGTVYINDTTLSDGSAIFNINYAAADELTFNNLFSNIGYYFRVYSYNGSGSQINYKTDGIIPEVYAITSGSPISVSSILLDNFNRTNSTSLGTTLPPQVVTWQETETVSPSSIILSANKSKLASTTSGREFAHVNLGSVIGYPSVFSNSAGQLIWAFNIRQTRLDPSGFDNNNYGTAFILGKTSTDLTTGNGYAVVLGNSGSTDAVRLARFTNGINANSRFTNIIAAGDYSNQYLSIKVIYDRTGNVWSLFVDSSSAGFPQTDPRNTATQSGTSPDSSYTSASLPFLGVLWNHASGASDSLIFDDVYVPSGSTSLNLTSVIEGFYDGVKLGIRDTATVYLRNSGTPFAVVDSSKAVIDSLTFTGSFVFNNTVTGNYYIEMKSRNGIETWSKLPQSITAGTSNSYDFTASIDKAFGNNLILKNGKYCIYSGDPNQDGAINLTDIISIFNSANSFATGYIATDLNGDRSVNLTDILFAFNNSLNFIVKAVP
ncbi:MAG: endonuclease [Ignavibacteria bacterium]